MAGTDEGDDSFVHVATAQGRSQLNGRVLVFICKTCSRIDMNARAERRGWRFLRRTESLQQLAIEHAMHRCS